MNILDLLLSAKLRRANREGGPIVNAHRHCANHRAEIAASVVCGCFYRCEAFPPEEIEDWIEETSGSSGQAADEGTAMCPRCGIDSVIGDKSGHPVADPHFLKAMHKHWFE